jgi:hypothetical protein
MSDTDQMTDSAELHELRGAFADASLPDAPPLDRITARGDARRHRRHYAIAVASVAAVTVAAALALGLTRGGGAPTDQRAASSPKLRTIQRAAYTLVSNSDGTTTFTINPLELFDASQLQADLAQFGIPAKVTEGSICYTDPEPAAFAQVYSYDPGVPGGDAVITIDPTAIPAGTELSFGEVRLPSGPGAAKVGLIEPDSFTCSSTYPADTPDENSVPGSGFFHIPGGSATSQG